MPCTGVIVLRFLTHYFARQLFVGFKRDIGYCQFVIFAFFIWLPPLAKARGFLLQDGQARPQECSYWHWYLYHAMCHTKHISILLFQAIFYLSDYWRWFHRNTNIAGSCISHSRFQNGNLRSRICRSVVVSVQTSLHRKPIWRVCLFYY